MRDLGGVPLAGGGETAFGVVVRADWLPGLSDEGRRALVDYGVSLVVDLRPDREHEDEGERERRRRIVEPPGRTLVEVLEEIEQEEGIRDRLLAAGADDAALDRLVARLRGNAV